MNNQITTRDIELLSAYLDNQLSSKDRTQLETRLKVDPALRKELQELNKTRLLLRQLPRKRAPRNYYIKPEAIRTRPTLKLAPVFGVVSGVASVLLALVLIGNRMVAPTSQVAMAPAAPLPQETTTSQQEISRSGAVTVPPTEAPPAIAMSAPSIAVTSTPFSPPTVEAGQIEIPSPTTIYLFAYLPTSTPEGALSIAGIQAETPTLPCEEYYGTEPLPDIDVCATPTETSSQFLESILPAASSVVTQTLTATMTTTSTPTATATPTPTASPTSTETPSPTETPSATATVVPTETQAPLSAQKAAPSNITESSTQGPPPGALLGTGNEDTVATQPTEAASTPSNFSFLNYIMLTLELSLAAIAVIAGITAIILRIRSR